MTRFFDKQTEESMLESVVENPQLIYSLPMHQISFDVIPKIVAKHPMLLPYIIDARKKWLTKMGLLKGFIDQRDESEDYVAQFNYRYQFIGNKQNEPNTSFAEYSTQLYNDLTNPKETFSPKLCYWPEYCIAILNTIYFSQKQTYLSFKTTNTSTLENMNFLEEQRKNVNFLKANLDDEEPYQDMITKY